MSSRLRIRYKSNKGRYNHSTSGLIDWTLLSCISAALIVRWRILFFAEQ